MSVLSWWYLRPKCILRFIPTSMFYVLASYSIPFNLGVFLNYFIVHRDNFITFVFYTSFASGWSSTFICLPLPVKIFSFIIFLFLVLTFPFPFKETCYIFSKGDLVVMNSFHFCLFGKFFISFSILNDNLACWVFSVVLLVLWKCHATPFCFIKFLLKKQVIVLWGFLCM